jgi:tetratricopeptide (TPR) repeat protein
MTAPFARTARTAAFAAVFALSTFAAAAQEATPVPEPLPVCPALEGQPREVRVSFYMGEGTAYLNAGLLGQAESSFTCIIRVVDGDYTPAYLARADVYTRLRDIPRALADYNAAISQDADSVTGLNNRGILFVIGSDLQRAANDFDAALDLAPNDLDLINNRVVVAAAQGEYDEAFALLDGAITRLGLGGLVSEARDPARTEPLSTDAAALRLLGLRGVLQAAQALATLNDYAAVNAASNRGGDERFLALAGSLDSRLSFELRFDDLTLLVRKSFAISG